MRPFAIRSGGLATLSASLLATIASVAGRAEAAVLAAAVSAIGLTFLLVAGGRLMREDAAGRARLTGLLRRARRHAARLRSALRQTTRRLRAVETCDPVTGLPNLRGLEAALAGGVGADDGETAVVRLDLDRFEPFVDAMGRAAGDRLLRHVGEALSRGAGPRAVVARIGGDEFAVAVDLNDIPEGPESYAARLVRRIAAPERDAMAGWRASAAAGFASGRLVGRDPATLMAHAELALRSAKRRARDRCVGFTTEIQTEVDRLRRLSDDLLPGLAAGQIAPFYQPQFCARTLDMVGAEALARWRHPELGLLGPFQFLRVAEDLGVLNDVDHAMLVAALGDQLRWKGEGVDVGRVSVNVSIRRLEDVRLIEELRAMTIPRGAVAFELLESQFLDKRSDVMAWNLDNLAEMGVAVEIDDFGTGHASIVGVMAMAPHRLKIAREIVTPLSENPRQRELVKAIVQIGKTLGVEVTAEGVETAEHVRILQDLGCDVLQGFALARPMPAEEIVSFARAEGWRLAI